MARGIETQECAMAGYLEDLTNRLTAGVARLPAEVRQRHADYLRRAQNADGGFSGREGGSDLYYTGFALRGLALLGALDESAAQQAGEAMHSPKNCLPGSGWDVIDAKVVPLHFGIPGEAKRFVIAKGRQRALVYFW